MKGITHFTLGVAIASCFPEAVKAAAAGNPLYFVIGGAFGLLPDTLDFRFVRFLYPHHTEIAPDPLIPDPALIAHAIADSLTDAMLSKRTIRVKLDSMPLGEDQWLRYHVHFDVVARTVRVEIGDSVDTGGQPLAPPPIPKSKRTATVPLGTDIHIEYMASTTIDIFDGPMFSMEPTRNGSINVRFIPWHREWTHSLPIAAAFGLATGFLTNVTCGIIAGLAFAAHGGVDHLGQLGTNLLFPFQKRRRWGLGWLTSAHTFGNLTFTWASCVLIFWNLMRAAALPASPITFGALLLTALAPYAALKLTR